MDVQSIFWKSILSNVDRSKMRDYMRSGEVEEGGERSGESQLLSWIPAPGQGGSENIVWLIFQHIFILFQRFKCLLHLCNHPFRERWSGYWSSSLLQGEVNKRKAGESSFFKRELEKSEDVLHRTQRVINHLLLRYSHYIFCWFWYILLLILLVDHLFIVNHHQLPACPYPVFCDLLPLNHLHSVQCSMFNVHTTFT